MESLEKCAVCGTTQADTLTRDKLLVSSVCGHRFCAACVERELSRRKHFACGNCGEKVSRSNLSEKTLDEITVSRDVAQRKRILAVYNKQQEDFDNLEQYNDYLEEVECIIFDVVNGVNVQETLDRVEAYKQANKDLIAANQARAVDSDQIAEKEIQDQRQQEEARRHYAEIEDKRRLHTQSKIRQEVMEVALGERDQVITTLTDGMNLGLEDSMAQQAIAPGGNREMLLINAPLPEKVGSSQLKRQYDHVTPRDRKKAQQKAAAAPTRADGHMRNMHEAFSSVLLGA